jgi:hypothetical protein
MKVATAYCLLLEENRFERNKFLTVMLIRYSFFLFYLFLNKKPLAF